MTQKELLYMEDAIEHEKNLIDIVTFTIDSLEDQNLVTFMKSELKKHESMKKKLLDLLEELANE
jgi:hypothetical protein